MADPTFDRARYAAALTTARLGRTLLARAEAGSTNDVAWEALAAGAPEGVAVTADVQSAGRGRLGRAWHTAPGLGLAFSVALRQGCDRRTAGTLPLVAGLALARALERCGAHPDLKWPNDLLLGGRKLAGILCESRRLPRGVDAVVIGVGVNVAQREADFPPALRATATSLAREGVTAAREQVAAQFCNALEPLWAEHEEGGRAQVLAAWTARAAFWGAPVVVTTPAGAVHGVARGLTPEGGLTLELAGGREQVVLAGDVEWPAGRAR
ncbi:MAG TPA: biotin--[acetyl-CoA-carboxylase] ligase [Candidatus Eisenbacteria bacterium]|nr:biotin--[acetyl-CoA-carboxylase] ligase [Candidatus Eisenbacteria bacterium]